MSTDLGIVFSDNLKRIRIERNIRQAEMAERLTISQQVLSKIERRPDGHCDPKLSTVSEVAKAFKLPPFAMLIKDVAAPDVSEMKSLLDIYVSLPAERRDQLLSQARYFAEMTDFETAKMMFEIKRRE